MRKTRLIVVVFVEVGELENVHDLITGENQLLYNTPLYYINSINTQLQYYKAGDGSVSNT